MPQLATLPLQQRVAQELFFGHARRIRWL